MYVNVLNMEIRLFRFSIRFLHLVKKKVLVLDGAAFYIQLFAQY